MTWLEIIESSAIGGGGLAVGIIAYLKSKDKNQKEVKLAKINQQVSDCEKLKAQVEKATKKADEAADRAEKLLNQIEAYQIRLVSIQQGFSIIYPILQKFVKKDPESMEGLNQLKTLIEFNQHQHQK
jgi:hypothetical protein